MAATLMSITHAAPADAQLDPLLFLKSTQPRIILAIDTSSRMQRDAPMDPAAGDSSSNYYDPVIYTRTGSTAEGTLGVTPSNTASFYRRRYDRLAAVSSQNPDVFSTSFIQISGDRSPEYALFDAATRLSVARAALYQAILMNAADADFGLIKMRQTAPQPATAGNAGPVTNTDGTQNVAGSTDAPGGTWTISMPRVSGPNALADPGTAVVVDASSATSNQDTQTILQRDARVAGGLLPAGRDAPGAIDAPLTYLLDDVRTEVLRLTQAPLSPCANTIVVLVTGGGEGGTVAGPPDPSATARAFLSVAGHRVPIYVIAIAPPLTDVPDLKAIASASGGRYVEITKADIDRAMASPFVYAAPIVGTVVVPEAVAAVNFAIQHGLGLRSDVDAPPTAAQPLGPPSEFQTAGPIVATVNLANAHSLTGDPLENAVVTDRVNVVIPQRSNTLITTAITLPGFAAALRAFRQYHPVLDASNVSGWRFEAARTPLWSASTPDPDRRNLYTAAPDGRVIPFTDANAVVLAPLMNLAVGDARSVIASVRAAPLGAVLDSTPAVMNPPSLDPPPDLEYARFASDNKRRRDLVWIGTNAGMLEAIDARLGVEMWGFIPPNLLPKLYRLRLGDGITGFTYFVDASPKLADVKIDGAWRTHLVVGEGPGGTFYQSFDVTLRGMADVNHIAPDADDVDALLRFFSDPGCITLNWTFPQYASFDPALPQFDAASNQPQPFGDLRPSSPRIEKTVGQTWSSPVIGQVGGRGGPFAVIVGSGFLAHSTEVQPNRAGVPAGTTVYVLSAKDGHVYASVDAANDGRAETIDDCAVNGLGSPHAGKRVKRFACDALKNALQADVAAVEVADRVLTRAYTADLDGRIWRLDISLDAGGNPAIALRDASPAGMPQEPVFHSLALVSAGASEYVFVTTGSELLPDAGTPSHVVGLIDQSGVIAQAFVSPFGGGVRAAGAPIVAGDVVFVTGTEVLSGSCPDSAAQLMAFQYSGGAAFDSNHDGRVDNTDSSVVARLSGVRATAPFVADRHLVFGAGASVAQIGDAAAFNNGVGGSRMRVLSWREVR
jgi:hypothetical protein